MRTRLLTAFAVALGLAVGLGSRADDKDKDNDKAGDRGASGMQTVRGTIAGVTVEGELVIDYKTNRAVEADMTMLTIVGSPVGGDAAARGKDHAGASKGRHRHNVYVVWLSPRTKVKDESSHEQGKDERSKQGPDEPAKGGRAPDWDAIEVGDHVEVTFTPRDDSGTQDRPERRKHGRHRIAFGDASSLTILSQPSHHHDERRGSTNPNVRQDDK